MQLAVWPTVQIKERSTLKWPFAIVADKALFMPLAIECRQVSSRDGLVTTGTLWSKGLQVALLTKWPTFPLVKTALSKGSITPSTTEAFGMPCLIQGRKAGIFDGSLTATTFHGELFVIVLLAVGTPVLLEEGLSTQRCLASTATEAFHMPDFTKSRHDLA